MNSYKPPLIIQLVNLEDWLKNVYNRNHLANKNKTELRKYNIHAQEINKKIKNLSKLSYD